jgi:TolC family type I secretion outer membrane protein
MMPWLRVCFRHLRVRFWPGLGLLVGLGACSDPTGMLSQAGLAPPPPIPSALPLPVVLPPPDPGSRPGTKPEWGGDGNRMMLAALENTYENNSQLNDARQQLKIVDEHVSQAVSQFRPQLQASFNETFNIDVLDQKYKLLKPSSQTTEYAQRVASLNLVQPVYTPGAAAAVRSSDNVVLAARASVTSIEQQTLLSALGAYIQVWRDGQLVKLFKDNEVALDHHREITQQRFKYGEVSNTDNLQTETRLSKARADRMATEGSLEGSRATFRQVVGFEPGELPDALPDAILSRLLALMPATLDEALAAASQNSADVISSRYAVAAAREAIDAIGRDRQPQLRILGVLSHSLDNFTNRIPKNIFSPYMTRDITYQVGLQLVLPLYRSGSVDSQIRAAKQTLQQRQFAVDTARRGAERAVTAAWQSLSAARRAMDDRLRAVAAAEQALDGVRLEAVAGTRTVLDILNAQQELVDARAALVTTRTTDWIATATLLAALGRFTAQELDLKVKIFDPEQNYRDVRNRWIGTSLK